MPIQINCLKWHLEQCVLVFTNTWHKKIHTLKHYKYLNNEYLLGNTKLSDQEYPYHGYNLCHP